MYGYIQPGMAAKTSLYIHEQIVRLWKEGKTRTDIVSIVEIEGLNIACQIEGQGLQDREKKEEKLLYLHPKLSSGLVPLWALLQNRHSI